MYLKTGLRTIALKSRVVLAINLVGALLFAGVYAIQTSPPDTSRTWQPAPLPPTTAAHPPRPLDTPVILADGLLWRAVDGLRFAAWDGATTQHYTWVQGIPVDWDVVPGQAVQHLFWRTEQDDLWHARLDAAGRQLSAPFALVNGRAGAFAGMALAEDEALVLWIDSQSGVLEARRIGSGGRVFPSATLAEGVEVFAVSRPSATLPTLLPRVAWVSANTLFSARLDADDLSLTDIQQHQTWPSDVAATELSVWVLQTEDAYALIWGARDPQRPDATLYEAMSVISQGTRHDVWPFSQAIPQRWATPAADSARLALTLWQNGVWLPTWVALTPDGTFARQTIPTTQPVNGGPPHMNETRLVWTTFDGRSTDLVLYRPQVVQPPPLGPALAEALPGAWRALAWLMLPGLVAWRMGQQPAAWPVALGIFWGVGLVYLLGAGRMPMSDVLWALGVTNLAGYFVTLGLLQLIAAGLSYTARPGISIGVRQGTYLLTLAIMTCAIFHASVE